MISFEHNFVFIHVPKTGGNSIQLVLEKYSVDKIVAPLFHQDGYNRFSI